MALVFRNRDDRALKHHPCIFRLETDTERALCNRLQLNYVHSRRFRNLYDLGIFTKTSKEKTKQKNCHIMVERIATSFHVKARTAIIYEILILSR